MPKIVLLVLALCLAAQARVEVKTLTLSDPTPRCQINILYPEVRMPDRPEAARAINQTLSQEARESAAQFRRDWKKDGQEDPRVAPGWGYEAKFEVVYETPRLIVFLLRGYDFRGGAHGMPVVEPFVFELATGKRLGPSDFYHESALKIFSQYTRKGLRAQEFIREDPRWIDEGTEPTWTNFQVQYPTAKGVLVIFPAYQVAPYAAGMPEVLVPYSVLAPAAKPGTPTRP